MKLEKLLGVEINDCTCGKVHQIPTREVHLQPGAINCLPEVIDRHFPGNQVVCALDTNTWAVIGERAIRVLRDRGKVVDIHFVDRHQQPAHADRKTVEDLVAVIKERSSAGVLAIGAGTINDIGKSASTATARPLITIATAASMNGYPSAISALTAEGVKITEPCHPPVAIIADPQVLATAPAKMTGAGFGDLLSKNASTADWAVAHQLHGEYFCKFAASVAEDAVTRCIDNVDAIRQNKPESLKILAEALVRSGIAMVIAGTSAPASGGEHLISHLWDMTTHWSTRTPALHGAQTGVTTLISLKLYEKLLALDLNDVKHLAQSKPMGEAKEAFRARMRTTFGDIAEGVVTHAQTKYLSSSALLQRRQHICDRWENIRRAVAPIVISAETSRHLLKAAGAVFRTADLGISDQELAFSYLNARWIRNRYTVLDLAAELGVLEQWQNEALECVQGP